MKVMVRGLACNQLNNISAQDRQGRPGLTKIIWKPPFVVADLRLLSVDDAHTMNSTVGLITA